MAKPSGGNLGAAGICPSGSYCPSGRADAPIPCGRGTYNEATGGKEISDCNDCMQGYYCETEGLSNVTAQCDPGYYCKRGAQVRNPWNVTENWGPCPVGTYCPRGSSAPIQCEAGTFNDRIGQETCFPCLDEYYCETGAINRTICPKGYYCANG